MRYMEFKNKVINLPIIVSRDITFSQKNKQILRNQLKRWQDKGLIIKLRRGMYILNKNERKINPSSCFIANQLYSPSYVSLEYALNFYGLIPERVVELTCVTTKKTMRFVNDLGNFTYQHLKPETFRGFKAVKDNSGLTFFIAEPEKAVIDFLYLNIDKIKGSNIDIFKSSYRFQNTETLNQKRIVESAKLFNNKNLTKTAYLFCKFIKKEKKR